jgi:hypothetical protein
VDYTGGVTYRQDQIQPFRNNDSDVEHTWVTFSLVNKYCNKYHEAGVLANQITAQEVFQNPGRVANVVNVAC